MTSEEPTGVPVDAMKTYNAMPSPTSKEKRLRSSVTQPLLSIKAAIDNKPSAFCAPVDFTFHDLTCLTECLTQEPTNEKNIGDTTARTEEEESAERPKMKANALRFSNNLLGDEIWSELETVCSKIVCNFSDVEWMDLSFNALTTIDKRLPDLFPNCKVLYLHGNQLTQMNDVKKLASMRQLRTVTLHGNPLAENTDGYRPTAISNLPATVKTLDYTVITAQDLLLAQYNPNKKKKKRKKKVAD